ncbi:MAG: MerR family transcriptional regulator [Clostridia bacterium]|nr:MerR family transcriptional regulator [Clostridia bacterium]
MPKYTTGEIAKLCGVSVRTVQYYDSRGILVPSGLSEGGRRLYSEDDLSRMKIICFLRDLGLPIKSIGQLLNEESPERVISLLLDQQVQTLRSEMDDRRKKLDSLERLRRELKAVGDFSVESIGDIALVMKNKNGLKRLHAAMLLIGIPVGLIQWTAIILLIVKGIWWPLIVWAAIAIPCCVWLSVYYYKKVSYICPQCHEVFRPTFRQMFFAPHTPKTRKLTCTKCGHRGFCVEICADADEDRSGSEAQ